MSGPVDEPAARDGDGRPGEGRRDSLASLLDGHDEDLLDRLYASILRRVGRDADAAQDIYVDCLRALVARADHDRIPPCEQRKLLFGIARFMIADWWKAADRVTPAPPSDFALLFDALSDPYAQIDRKIDVERALGCLHDRQREALVLVYLDRLPYDMTAGLMGISVNGVKRLLAKAKTNLHTGGLLDGHGDGPTARKKPQTGTAGEER
ncbi:RNA polymerase sigma factor [Amycolatopsis azurea]|uniref:RNA polymerase sigma factor 70 region 4 type 2 domain-containing protein n=1 Tax=Amycolatopsis azurea DSM 43854 TaxID=1238180 RepID=M2PKB3_9PSEU|nr:RNA polymerase sigma factor [Amycolatopsis azurea]EMD24908.1 hypothetical protein C791_5490 [Amycolatopsis azurea DSM 43854]OOC07709.1 hypothetical protein B0293_06130 [Amycolatopsis azurea DSM 43854]